MAVAGRGEDIPQLPAEVTREREDVCWGHSVPKFGVNKGEVMKALLGVARGKLLVPAVSPATLQGSPPLLLLPPAAPSPARSSVQLCPSTGFAAHNSATFPCPKP